MGIREEEQARATLARQIYTKVLAMVDVRIFVAQREVRVQGSARAVGAVEVLEELKRRLLELRDAKGDPDGAGRMEPAGDAAPLGGPEPGNG